MKPRRDNIVRKVKEIKEQWNHKTEEVEEMETKWDSKAKNVEEM